jgi:hypothetical protein
MLVSVTDSKPACDETSTVSLRFQRSFCLARRWKPFDAPTYPVKA